MIIEKEVSAKITLGNEDFIHLACMLKFCEVVNIAKNIEEYENPFEQLGFTAYEIGKAKDLFCKLYDLINI
jgi:hypothetical protein